MRTTYRAMQVTMPGTLELVERPVPKPDSGEVLIDIEACGICGADTSDIEGVDPNQRPPRVPGHEVVGRIVADVIVQVNRSAVAKISLADPHLGKIEMSGVFRFDEADLLARD